MNSFEIGYYSEKEKIMFFSVLIPVYNVENYIYECINSVLFQDERDFEIILCDDGSTDGSGAICDEYSQKYPDKIKVIHKKNEGLLLTRRRAIKEACGDWFVHLDSDDRMFPNALSEIRKAAENSEADLVVYSYIRGKQNSEDLSDKAVIPFEDGEVFTGDDKYRFLMQFLYGGSLTAIWQKSAKRNIVDIDADYSDIGFVSNMEDYLQSMPLLSKANKIVYIDKPLFFYRYNENGITKKKSFQSYINGVNSISAVYGKEADFRKNWNIRESDEARVLAKHFRKLCLLLTDAVQVLSNAEIRIIFSKIANDSELKKDFNKADRRAMGKKSLIIFRLVFGKMFTLANYICRL